MFKIKLFLIVWFCILSINYPLVVGCGKVLPVHSDQNSSIEVVNDSLALPYTNAVKPVTPASSTVTVYPTTTIAKISPLLFGTNANTFSGQMVNERPLIDHIRALDPGLIRYPGGNISSMYFWNTSKWFPPKDVPTEVFVSQHGEKSSEFWFGQNDEPWTLSLENYYKLLGLTRSDGMVTVNYGYARYGTSKNPVSTAAHMAANWVRYDKGRTKYWEVGNESYGHWQPGWKIDVSLNKDKQPAIMDGAIYGAHFKVFADSMRKAAAEIGIEIKIGAQLIARPTVNNDNPAEPLWNKLLLSTAGLNPDFFIVHSYFTPYGENNNVDEILRSGIEEPGEIMKYVKRSIADAKVSEKPVALTEWNIFSEGSKQKVSHIAGVHAVIVLAELIKANFSIAARWGLLGKYTHGDDFGTISIGDEPDNAAKWNPRPIFYYLYYFKRLFGDVAIATKNQGNAGIISYASRSGASAVSIVLINTSEKEQTVAIEFSGKEAYKYYYSYTLAGEQHEKFSRKVFINGAGPKLRSGGPLNFKTLPAFRTEAKGGTKVKVPKHGVVFLVNKNT
jgi:hypothetical protein